MTSLVLGILVSGCATSIYQAAERGDLATVRQRLEEDPRRVDMPDGRSLTALHYSASEGHVEIVRALLEAGGDANAAALGGVTVLFVAAANGHPDVVKLLLEHGADAETRSPWNPLRVAAGEGDVATVKVLLVHGANPEGHNIPPLMAAAAGGHVGVMQLLVEAGAKVNRVTLEDFSSALTIAAARGQLEAVEWLIARGADVKHDDAHGRTALMLAELNGHPRVAEVLRAAQ